MRQAERTKNVDPVLTAAEISKQEDELIDFATPILTRPKPKPPKDDGDDGTETLCSGAQTPNPPPKGGTPKPEMKTEEAQGPPAMDVLERDFVLRSCISGQHRVLVDIHP